MATWSLLVPNGDYVLSPIQDRTETYQELPAHFVRLHRARLRWETGEDGTLWHGVGGGSFVSNFQISISECSEYHVHQSSHASTRRLRTHQRHILGDRDQAQRAVNMDVRCMQLLPAPSPLSSFQCPPSSICSTTIHSFTFCLYTCLPSYHSSSGSICIEWKGYGLFRQSPLAHFPEDAMDATPTSLCTRSTVFSGKLTLIIGMVIIVSKRYAL